MRSCQLHTAGGHALCAIQKMPTWVVEQKLIRTRHPGRNPSMTAPATTAASKPRIPVFDGIRGLCALSVVITHVAFTTIVLPSAMGDPKQGFWSILAAGNDLGIGPFF